MGATDATASSSAVRLRESVARPQRARSRAFADRGVTAENGDRGPVRAALVKGALPVRARVWLHRGVSKGDAQHRLAWERPRVALRRRGVAATLSDVLAGDPVLGRGAEA